MDGVEEVEADHGGHKVSKLRPGIAGDSAEQEGVQDDGHRGQPGHQGHAEASGRVLLPANDVHGQRRDEPARRCRHMSCHCH